MRKITVAVTVDDRMGIAFNKRRQSSDKRLIDDLIGSTRDKIYISSYSLPLFSSHTDRVVVSDEPLKDCPDGAFCFIEMTELSKYEADINTLIVYCWNRHYPSDKKLNIDLETSKFKMVSETEFVGKSHEQITKNIYHKQI